MIWVGVVIVTLWFRFWGLWESARRKNAAPLFRWGWITAVLFLPTMWVFWIPSQGTLKQAREFYRAFHDREWPLP